MQDKKTRLKYVQVYQQENIDNDIFFAINMKCKRPYNEDRMLIIQKKEFQIYMTLDGHGGSAVSTYAQSYFNDLFTKKNNPFFGMNNKTQILNYFQNHLDILQNNIQSNKKIYGEQGSTFNTLLVLGNKIYCINMGDSRSCGYLHNDSSINMSDDHKPTLPKEKEIIKKNGGFVSKDGRVDGILAISRALGDSSLNLYRKAEIKEFNKNELLMICTGSDGIWDKFNSKQIYSVILSNLSKNNLANPLGQVYEKYQTKFEDNISLCAVILYNK